MTRHLNVLASRLLLPIALTATMTQAASLPVTANLQVWLDAGQDVTTSGSDVTAWADQSGNNLDVGPLGNAPELVAADMNGQPVIRFEAGNTEALQPSAFSFGNEGSVFIVFRDSGGNDTNNPSLYTWRQANFGMAFGSDADQFSFRPRVLTQGANARRSPTDTDADKLGEAHYTNNPGGPSATSDIGLNGSLSTYNETNAYEGVPGSTMTRTIGAAVNGGYLNGDIAEIIQYSTNLNRAERTLTRNYLAAKYGVVLNSTDVYVGDESAQNNYDRDVFGIGEETDGSVTSGSAAGLTVTEDASSLDAGEYLMAGHRVATNGLTSADVAYGQRWERVWYLDKTGEVDATLVFDFSDAGLGAPLKDTYHLIYSSTNAFSFTILDTASVVGDQLTFSLINTQLEDGYYTVQSIPEPTSGLLLSLAGLFARRRRRQ